MKRQDIQAHQINHDKTYVATLKLGIKTDTGDIEGKIIEQSDVDENKFDEEYVNTILKSLIGEQTQTPPIYSAIKVNGKKLYEYARNNQEVQIPARTINIYDIKLINIDKANKEICFKKFFKQKIFLKIINLFYWIKMTQLISLMVLNCIQITKTEFIKFIMIKFLLEQVSYQIKF